MRKTFPPILILFIISIAFFNACDPYDPEIEPCNMMCAVDDYYLTINVLSKSDSADLVFGPSRVYDKDKIRFFSLKGMDTAFFEYNHMLITPADCVLSVQLFPMADTAYMDLGNGDIDTLQTEYITISTKCCGEITDVNLVMFNNSQMNGSFLRFYK